MIHTYTGSGKGKTTAAIGLAIRALGQGLSVFWISFDKGGTDYGERTIFSQIQLPYFATGRDRRNNDGTFDFSLRNEDKEEAEKAIHMAYKKIHEADILILDEVLNAIRLNCISESALSDLLKITTGKNSKHLILTGRDPTKNILKYSDLRTEMQNKKHYFSQQVPALKGLEY